ncbi:bifunctional precorrin-2 dehydrogenase/sirohydrochlorin ferrochelatase [Paraclostridium ghonii]|uniref:precorrin-2 dehydrogenase/sirohydrochlorin ferrochelatase family protein n=1 Tax=Paraclostridium ghonii TaxID=29358 RepID=UPI00202CE1F2|nr:bifunctional precorrin-2 dehydrogenase/sirohydrochlorin ferrochelatase [Paeniclostridium ghonii]MCM0165976.1 bifunctional precorrin-2 dehydrogenase/sirohydrochlorin ferrochelatase [Paeniclostridium ghonii]
MNYPIMINLDGKEITVIGGGKIAYRKVKNFVDFGYKVRVISLGFIEKFKDIEDSIELIKDKYKEEYIENSFIVVAATNNRDINKSIGMYCNQKNKLVNIVDDPMLSSYIVPSTVKRGDLIIGVSTCGKSPSLAAKIKKDLEKTYDDSYEEYIELLGTIRNKILEKYDNPYKKKQLLNEIINLNLEELKKYNI